MEIVIRISPEELAKAVKEGGMTASAVVGDPPKKRGRPPKEEAPEVEETDDEADEEDEAPKKKAPKKAATKKKAEEVEEDDEEETDDEAEEDDEEAEADEEDEPEYATGKQLDQIKKALTAHSKASGKKAETVKILRKFAPSSEKVKVDDVAKLLKALKV